jgi:uncharacterized protein YbaR (Trm112 family)
MGGAVDPELLELLACPACRGVLRPGEDCLVCASCGLRYPVRDGIPVLLVEEAQAPEGA